MLCYRYERYVSRHMRIHSSRRCDSTHSTKTCTSIVALVENWAESFVIKENLCPWAAQSKKRGELKVIGSSAKNEMEAISEVSRQADALLLLPREHQVNRNADDHGPRHSKGQRKNTMLATTLLAFDPELCSAWVKDFDSFDAFVLRAGAMNPDVSLVAFHPDFNRWRNVTGCCPEVDFTAAGGTRRGSAGAPPPLRPGVEVMAYRQDAYVNEDALAVSEAAGRDANIAAAAAARPTSTLAQRDKAHRLAKAAELAANMECTLVRSEFPSRAVVVNCDEAVVGVRTVRLRFFEDEENGSEHADEERRNDLASVERKITKSQLTQEENGVWTGDVALTGEQEGDDEQEEDEEESVHVDWVVSVLAKSPGDSISTSGFDRNSPFSSFLADNRLHRCPVPVVHILRSDVLSEESERVGDQVISDLQMRNALLMRERPLARVE
mmetsp:Transcript_76709/g.153936  ORF Transcript_76709/g.153936 Transcript_76709/m.153936 type:complete len:439 (+) Transcript_76709:137-1453(+)